MDRRIPWPDGLQCPAVLCFHVDAESLLVSTDPENVNRPITLSQGTYGPRLGIPRILRLLEKYNLKASFYVPGLTAERHPYAVEAIVAAGHELGVHGYTHDRPDSFELEREEEEMVKAKEILEGFWGQKVRGYGSPAWEYSVNTLDLLRKHGFDFAADAMDEDVPYYLFEDDDFVQLPVSWMLDDAPLYWFGLLPPLSYGGPYAEPSRVYELWTSEFEALYEDGAYFHLTLHPFLSGRGARMKTLERLVQAILLRPNVKFCTPSEVVDMYRSVVTREQGRPGAWFPANGDPAPQPTQVDGVPLLGF